MTLFGLDACLTFAAMRARHLQKLLEGDPVAWSLLGIAVVAVIGWMIVKAKFFSND